MKHIREYHELFDTDEVVKTCKEILLELEDQGYDILM